MKRNCEYCGKFVKKGTYWKRNWGEFGGPWICERCDEKRMEEYWNGQKLNPNVRM